LIKFEIDKFRDYIKNKKEKIRSQKNLIEKMIKEEEQLDEMFLDEISKELDKNEKEEEEKIKYKYEQQNSKFKNIEEKNNENKKI